MNGASVTTSVLFMGSELDHNDSHRAVAGGLARAAIFGVSDGLVTNVSLVLGFAGAQVGADIVRLGGIAGAIADAASMAAGEWVSVSAQNELVERELEIERRAMRENPIGETIELAAFYESHGMSKEQAASAAQEVMMDPERAILVHAREEFGIDPNENPNPVSVAVLSFFCFIVGAVLPVIPWFFGEGNAATATSIGIGVTSAAMVGSMIGKSTERSVFKTAIRQVFIMLLACGATYLVGKLFNINVS